MTASGDSISKLREYNNEKLDLDIKLIQCGIIMLIVYSSLNMSYPETTLLMILERAKNSVI
jgi:hypothetical protein